LLFGISRFLKSHRSYHVAAALERIHLFQQLGFSVNNAATCRRIHLVTRKNKEITVDILHVNRHVRGALSAIDEHRYSILMGLWDPLVYWIDRSQPILHMGYSNQFRPLVQQAIVLIQ